MAAQPEERPWKEAEARTMFVPISPLDWLLVKQGRKTEFRLGGRGVPHLTPPCPVVGYTFGPVRGYEAVLLTLEAAWREPVSAISPESLEREGFPDMAHFRRYWMQRTNARFRPLDRIQVFQVHPLRPDEYATAGLQLFHKLYGEHVDVGH